jgi:predicted TIM-barrel fold metal-dependent hydrolase
MGTTRESESSRLRARLGHPIVDADGHLLELIPVFQQHFIDFVREIGGGDAAAEFAAAGDWTFDKRVIGPWSAMTEEERRRHWAPRPPWWSIPAKNTLDRATAFLPRLMHERMDEMGIDFAVLYPSRTLVLSSLPNDELRRVATRALNSFHAAIYREYSDRLTPVAAIPMHTPEEAVDELEYAVKTLGLKAVMINGLVHRPVGDSATDYDGNVHRTNRPETFGIDSEYDYDPVWAKCIELKVAPASHAGGQGFGSRRSISSYVYNHIGAFGVSGEALSKSLFLGGVTRRFPELRVAFLEGGVGWACSLYADLVGHWEKRNATAIRDLDPAAVDVDLMMRLLEEYGDELALARSPAAMRTFFSEGEPSPQVIDEWAAVGIERPEEIRDLFVPRFFFGCEADDPMVAWAFNSKINPMNARLQPMFSSDVGHWDVPDMAKVLVEAHELVSDGHITDDDFRDFTFVNPVKFYASTNPDFFRGTRVEAEATRLLAAG